MSLLPEDSVREERICYEIVVDAYDSEERAMGWYYYLQNNLTFPFSARWLTGKNPEDVTVVDLSPEEDCLDGILVEIEYGGDQFSVRLEDIEPVNVDENTQTAIDDWHYWLGRGYEF